MAKKKMPLSQKIADQIKKQKISPKSKWIFTLKNAAFWLIFVLSVFAGARALGVVFFTFSGMDYGLLANSKGPLLKPLLLVFPLFWSSSFLLFLLLAMLGLHHTKNAYKIPLRKLVGINLGLSLVLGILLALAGDAKRLDHQFEEHVKWGRNLETRQVHLWSAPEQGRLAGVVIEKTGEEILLLNDFNQEMWTVYIQKGEQWRPFQIEKDVELRITGNMLSENEFEAEFLAPWKAHPAENLKENPPHLRMK